MLVAAAPLFYLAGRRVVSGMSHTWARCALSPSDSCLSLQSVSLEDSTPSSAWHRHEVPFVLSTTHTPMHAPHHWFTDFHTLYWLTVVFCKNKSSVLLPPPRVCFPLRRSLWARLWQYIDKALDSQNNWRSIKSDKVCVRRRSGWMDESNKHRTFTQVTVVHVPWETKIHFD